MPDWTSVKTFIADEYVDEDDLNTYISDNTQHLYDKINDLSSGVPGVNLVKNYPSLEKADGAQPEWWEVSGDPTLTEEDATGESIPQKHERVLKFVASADGGDSDYLYMRLVHADEPLLDESVSKLSVGMWVYTADAGTITLELYDVGGTTSLGTDTTTTTGSWVWLEVLNKTIGTTSTDIRLKHSANDATVYVAQPMANVGALVNTFQPRGLVYKENHSADIDFSNSTFADLDLSSYTSGLAVIVQVLSYTAKSGDSSGVQIRKNGSSDSSAATYVQVNYGTGAASKFCLMDDGQVVEVLVSNTPTTHEFYVLGFYEWES